MKCRHTICHQCEDAGLVSLREEYEIMREENEKLRALLAEVLIGINQNDDILLGEVADRIDATLGKPEVKG